MQHSWDDLIPYKGSVFHGEWPTIPELFEITLSKFASRPCFTVFSPNKITYTFNDVYHHIQNIASYLQEHGLKPGDTVTLYGKNSPEWAMAYLSVLFAGGVIVPIDCQLPIEKMLSLSAFAETTFIIALQKNIETILNDFPETSQMLLSLDPQTDNYILDLVPSQVHQKTDRSEDDLAAILFTSGTTGNEKGVMLTHKNFITDVYQACDPAFMTADEHDVFYALLPLHHSYAMTAVFLEQIKHGGELVFAKSFAIKRIIKDMQDSHVSIFMGIPLIYNKILAGLMKELKSRGKITYGVVRILMGINGFLKQHFGWNPGRTIWFKKILEGIGFYHNKLCICGGGPLPAKTFHQYQQLGLDFVQGYGLTETSPIVTLNPKHHFKIKSVGKVFPFIDIKIKDPDIFGVGEILLKGPNVTQGYLKDEENTKALFDEEGYLLTGDLGVLDKERYLYLRGRKKNLIVTSGGKNIYPEEIEDAFQLYPIIEQIMVRGYMLDKSNKSEAIEALIYPGEDAFGDRFDDKDFVEKKIKEAVREVNQKMPPYKKITRITILDEPMDMTTTRKIQRNKVLAKLDSLRGWKSTLK